MEAVINGYWAWQCGQPECNLNGWRAEAPKKPYLDLECNGSPVLTIDIEEAMANYSETVFVIDGANCTLEVQNATGMETFTYPLQAEPIWIVDYTIFHGNQNSLGEPVEILTHQSSDSEVVNFERIPDCYFRKLHNLTNTKQMYPSVGPRNEAVEWLLLDDGRNSDCEGQFFIERYKLVGFMLALNLSELLSRKFHCLWEGLVCSDSYATEIAVQNKGAVGMIPNEIGMLGRLESLDLCKIALKSNANCDTWKFQNDN